MDVLNESSSCLTCGAGLEEVRRDHRLITEGVLVRDATVHECSACDAYEISIERLGELLALIARERALHAMPLEARLCRRADETTWWSVVPSLSVEDCDLSWCCVGARVRCIAPQNDWQRKAPGTCGTVVDCRDFGRAPVAGRVWVVWDDEDYCFMRPKQVEVVSASA